jgi:hypothetical protein
MGNKAYRSGCALRRRGIVEMITLPTGDWFKLTDTGQEIAASLTAPIGPAASLTAPIGPAAGRGATARADAAIAFEDALEAIDDLRERVSRAAASSAEGNVATARAYLRDYAQIFAERPESETKEQRERLSPKWATTAAISGVHGAIFRAVYEVRGQAFAAHAAGEAPQNDPRDELPERVRRETERREDLGARVKANLGRLSDARDVISTIAAENFEHFSAAANELFGHAIEMLRRGEELAFDAVPEDRDDAAGSPRTER